MLNDLLETCSFGSSLSSCDSNEEFLAGTENMLTEIHSKVSVLLHATEKAMSEHEREMETVVSRGTCPDNVNALFIEGDPAGRRGLDFTDQHREYLIYKGAYQPVVAKYPINTISARKQYCFTKSWYTNNPFLQYSTNVEKAFCFACSLFGSETGCAEDTWSSEGVDRWDKMKSRGKQRQGKITQHFTSHSHRLAAEKFLSCV